MKYSAVILALAAAASAQTIASLEASIPACAVSCLNAAIAASGCSASDNVCQCTTGKSAITSSATTCITNALGSANGCSIPEALSVSGITDKICAIATGASSMAAATSSSSAMTVVAPASSVMSTSMMVMSSSTAPVSQLSDGQVQATSTASKASSTLAPVSQISDGQIQATATANKTTTAATSTYTPIQITGAAGSLKVAAGFVGAVAGLAAFII